MPKKLRKSPFTRPRGAFERHSSGRPRRAGSATCAYDCLLSKSGPLPENPVPLGSLYRNLPRIDSSLWPLVHRIEARRPKEDIFHEEHTDSREDLREDQASEDAVRGRRARAIAKRSRSYPPSEVSKVVRLPGRPRTLARLTWPQRLGMKQAPGFARFGSSARSIRRRGGTRGFADLIGSRG